LARTLKLTIAYDGTEFAGWQRQARERTVQAVIEDALAPIEKRPLTVTAAGRTDAGVHAAAQVGSAVLHSTIDCNELRRALNATLPEDVRVLTIEEAHDGFNARHEARLKTYHYSIWNGIAVPPVLRHYVGHVAKSLNLSAMNEAATLLVGLHDFSAFQATGSDVRTTDRRLLSSLVRELDVSPITTAAPGDRLLRYEVTGTGFLRHMVRNIVGTLVDVGLERTRADEVKGVLESRDRSRAGATAPPQGLVLWRVEY
jgi:tRNA pseudouridine38-40 synthase